MKVAVIGAGSWGSALSQLLGMKEYDVHLWARRDDVVKSINEKHVNPRYLSNTTLSENIIATTDISSATRGASAVVIVTPSQVMREVANAIKNDIKDNTPIIIASKGIDIETGLMSTQILSDILGEPHRLSVLSGPNHAEEVICGYPCGSVVASESTDVANFFQQMFASDTFRTYTSSDVCGVQLCAAYKNVIAIAVGMSYGLNYGDNTASLLITRGVAEMNRLICAAGGCSNTALGLAGVGDMIATCMSKHSRNRCFGEQFVSGVSLDEYKNKTHMVVEGARACRALCVLAKKYDVELPINKTVNDVLWEGASISTAKSLLTRPLKDE